MGGWWPFPALSFCFLRNGPREWGGASYPPCVLYSIGWAVASAPIMLSARATLSVQIFRCALPCPLFFRTTRWPSGWDVRPLPRRLQVRARQVPSVSDAARNRSRVFFACAPPWRPPPHPVCLYFPSKANRNASGAACSPTLRSRSLCLFFS